MKELSYRVQNVRDLCKQCELIDPNLKYTDLELLNLLDIHIRGLEGRLEKARRVYKENMAKLKKLENPQLWRFGNVTQAPPDYKAEYMRRIKEKEEELQK